MCLNEYMTEMTPGRLAKELGTSQFEMFHAMQDCGINLVRMSARLTASQEEKLRAYWSNKRAAFTRKADKAKAPRSRTQPVEARPLPQQDFPRTCPCCARRWIYRGVSDVASTVCPECAAHRSVSGEDMERRIARAESHAGFYLRDRDSARAAFAKAHSERQVMRDSRRKWQAALLEVLLDHEEGEDGACWCGDPMPCRTWRRLEETNKGIHRQVEKWSSWTRRQIDDYFYGDDRTAPFVLEEEEPADDRGR